MPLSHTLTLPQIRVSEFEVLRPVNRASTVVAGADWDAGVKALGNNIPGYRYSASEFTTSFQSLTLVNLFRCAFEIPGQASFDMTSARDCGDILHTNRDIRMHSQLT